MKPIFPLQFSESLEILSHLIEYPPRSRQCTIYYDYINKKARADIQVGYEEFDILVHIYSIQLLGGTFPPSSHRLQLLWTLEENKHSIL